MPVVPSNMAGVPCRRCAIYTRKSHDERADSQYGSITAQRELCEAYVASQAGDGWAALPERFDDEGFSGGTLRRPALAHLLASIAAGEVDTIVVYKIDRLSRSLRDFLELVAAFEQQGVTFVAITQNFSTTTSMGRLTLNVLLSFAQFEREVTSERLRDWFAGARRRGLWTSGLPPFGYDVADLRLTPNPEQAAGVRHAFRRYPVLRSVRAVAEELSAKGLLHRGRPLSARIVTHMLRNRVYRGELVHRSSSIPGRHQAIVTEAEFRRVSAQLDHSPRCRGAVHGRRPGALQDIVFGAGGRRLVHVTQHRRGRAYRYYLPSVVRYRVGAGPLDRYRAGDIERAVLAKLPLVEPAAALEADWHGTVGLVRRLVERVDVDVDAARIRLTTGACIEVDHSAACWRGHNSEG